MCCDCCKALASFHTYPLFRTLSNAEHETDNYIDIITVYYICMIYIYILYDI